MSEPRRWLEEDHGDADAVTRLLQSQRGFRALDAAAASRVKQSVLQATVPLPGQPFTRQPFTQGGAFGRLRSALTQLGQHQFSAKAVAATTLGAAAFGGLLAILGNVHLEDASSSRVELVQLSEREAASAALLQGSLAGSRAETVRTARDPWAAAPWGRRDGVDAELCWTATQTGAWQSTGQNLAERCLLDSNSGLNSLRGNVSFNEAGSNASLAAANGTLTETDAIDLDRDGETTTASSVRRAALRRPSTRASDSESAVTTASARRTGRAAGRSSGDPRGLRDETLLLEAARSDLARNPKSALQTALEHQQQFPQGQLTSQRLLIQIEAMLRLGQDASAINLSRSIHNPLFSSRAKDLLTRYGATDSVKE